MGVCYRFGDVDGIAVYEVWGDEIDQFPAALAPLIDAVGKAFDVRVGACPTECNADALALAEAAWVYGWDSEAGEIDCEDAVAQLFRDNTDLSWSESQWVARWYRELWPYAVQQSYYGSHIVFEVMDDGEYSELCADLKEDGIEDPSDVFIVIEDVAINGHLVVGDWAY